MIRHPRNAYEHWFEQTELWYHLRDVVNHIRRTYEVEAKEFDLSSKVEEHKNAVKINSLPDIEYGVQVMMKNVLKINNFCTKRKVKLVVVTQPVLWHKNMSEQEIKISCYSKFIKNEKTYTDEAMSNGMNIFNQKLLRVADQNNIYSIDLAKQLPKNTTVFFDHCHFNKSGSGKVANVIFQELEEILKQEKLSSSED